MARLVGATLAIGLTQVILGSSALAVAGDLDPTFSGDGTATTGFPGSASASGLAVQADGKIVAAGRTSDSTTGHPTFAQRHPRSRLQRRWEGDHRVRGRLR